ncbi:MAG TPA: FG-GAP-like repeat-containing protein [Stackebrandtia sp.]|uniref:FG-GAP-like repeat-containing protein n=1 Tax=Stackebrandtia sp. TaxID=2023065 RepID=UPI002D711DED|nr:FG-GAP-like repeat-containing protein [Stackebrandtia sp.]HZE40483.1 FG-GAP-like repeat-containing protein [Stackebrandtia sp.]
MNQLNLSRRLKRGGLIAAALALGTLAAGAVAVADADPTAKAVATTSDFDGDGKNDLVMQGSRPDSGEASVMVDYTSKLASKELYPSDAYGTQGFGVGLATGDLNGDGFDDLAVGCEQCDWEWSGATVSIFNGSSDGLKADSTVDTEIGSPQDAVAIGELNGAKGLDVASTNQGSGAVVSSKGDDYWGDKHYDTKLPTDDEYPIGAVAIGDVTGDGKPDLVLGSPTHSGGAVTVFPGPVDEGNSQTVKASDLGGTIGDLGAALAVADFTGDGKADILVGAPNSSTDTVACGAAVVLRGSASGISAKASQVIDQDTPGVPGVCESGDGFGASVAAGDLTGDGKPEAVVGVPNEGIDGHVLVGDYIELPHSPSGLTGTGSFGVSQKTTNVPGTVEARDYFSYALSIQDINLDGRADVLIGAPGEDVGSAKDAGLVTRLFSDSHGKPTSNSNDVDGTTYDVEDLGLELP